MSKPLIFLGSSNQIEYQYRDLCERSGISIAGIIDDDYFGNTTDYEGIPYIESEVTADFKKLKEDYDFFIGVNFIPDIPRNVQKKLKFMSIVDQHDLNCVNLIDPECRIGRNVILGQGLCIGYVSVIENNVTIGDHSQVNTFSYVAHNTVIGRNCTIQRNVAVLSNVTMGDNNYFGISSRLLKSDGMKIGSNCFVHPGLVVMRDINDNEIVSIAGRKVYSSIVS